MSFVRHRGKTKTMYFRKTDTTLASALTEGSLVAITDSGNLSHVDNDSLERVVGVSRITIAATDTSTWPGAPFVPVEVPVENMVEWRIDVDTAGGAVDSDIGTYIAVDTQEAGDSNATLVDMDDTAPPRVMVTGVESPTVVYGVLVNLGNTYFMDTLDTTG